MTPSLARYAPSKVAALLACPFCRELFSEGEADRCPSCGLVLADATKLPPSHEALADDDFGIPRQPHLEPLPRTYLGRGKGVLAALSLAGLAAFFAPWIVVEVPDHFALTGADLARRMPWAWGAGVAWFVLLPLALTRRSIDKMRGARAIAAVLAAMPLATAVNVWTHRPRSFVPLRYEWGPGLFATAALALTAVIVAIRFGGRVDVLDAPKGATRDPGATLH